MSELNNNLNKIYKFSGYIAALFLILVRGVMRGGYKIFEKEQFFEKNIVCFAILSSSKAFHTAIIQLK